MMKLRSGHFIFDKKIKYKDLAPIFGELFLMFLDETNQIPEEEEYTDMLIAANLMDLEENRKPEGYNRIGNMRLIFPIRKRGVEMYLSGSAKSTEVKRVTEKVSGFLKKKGLKHEVEWDKLVVNQEKDK